jgi:hypothetical protein
MTPGNKRITKDGGLREDNDERQRSVNIAMGRRTHLDCLGLRRSGHGRLRGFHGRHVLYRALKTSRAWFRWKERGRGGEQFPQLGVQQGIYSSCELALGDGNGEIIAGRGGRGSGPPCDHLELQSA